MKIPRRSLGRGVGFDMTPMIDIVFQLIIFFLVSSHLTRQEAHSKLPLPIANSGEKAEDDNAPRVTINVQPDGTILLGTAAVTLAELPSKLQAKRVASGEGMEVRIRSDRHVPYSLIAPLLKACAKADVWNVTFAVYRPEDARK